MADAIGDGLAARLGARIAVKQDGGRLTIRAVADHPLVAKIRITRTHVEFRLVSKFHRVSRQAHHSVAARGDRIDRIVDMLADRFQVEQLLASVSQPPGPYDASPLEIG